MAFLFGGLAFGFLLGFGLFRALETRPGAATATAAAGEIPSPMGPPAPTQTVAPGAGGAAGAAGAPMMAEINALKERVTKDPKDVTAWARLANLYQDVGMYEPAVNFYQRALALAPTDANLLTDAAICYQQLRQFDQALELLERAQKADPTHWQSLYNIVVVAGLDMGRVDQAGAALDRLQKIHPDAPNLAALRAALSKPR